MTRAQFLNDLYRRLPGLTQEQAEQHLTYYAEMLADRMEEGMSEEEAVASMEPVEVIAQRILQDEGIPENPAPPQYPDLPKTDGARFTKAPDMPRKRNWRKAGMVLLWIVAIVMAVSSVMRWLAARTASDMSYETSASESMPPVDYGIPEEEWEAYMDDWSDFEFEYLEDLWGLEIGPEGISGNNFFVGPDGIVASDGEHEMYIGPDGILFTKASSGITDDMVGARYRYKDDTYRLDVGETSKINIKWTTGIVKVRSWDEDYIQFQEFSDTKLRQSQKLEYSVDGDMLNISNRAGSNKGLIVWVPTHIEYLNTEASTAEVYWDQLAAEGASVNTTSGNIVITNSAFDSLTVQASSGNVTLRNVTAVELDQETTSGNASLDAVTAEQMHISASSGDVSGVIAGSYANISTSSGKITVNAGVTGALILESSSGTVTASLPSGAASYVSVDTTSGNVFLRLPEQCGFEMEFDSSSGYFDNGPFPAVRMGDRYVAEGYPAMSIAVDTSSGDLRLEAIE